MSRLDEIMQQIDVLRAEYKIAAQEKLNVGFKAIFDKYPGLNNVAFTAYTPYFNDGDVCNYRVHADAEYLELNGISGYELPFNGDFKYSDYTEDDMINTFGEDWLNIIDNASEEFSSLIFSIDYDTIEDIYGDHVKVIVSRDGVTVDDYKHHD